jgi:hypothetical protein
MEPCPPFLLPLTLIIIALITHLLYLYLTLCLLACLDLGNYLATLGLLAFALVLTLPCTCCCWLWLTVVHTH